MSSVLVGIFDSQAQAQAAKARLQEAGFAEQDLELTAVEGGATTASAAADTMTPTDVPHHEGAIARFFHRLFGEDDHDERAGYTDHYSEAFRRGACALTVSVADDEAMDRAERILNEAGAVDIDERAQQWRASGWTGGQTPATGTGIGASGAQPRTSMASTGSAATTATDDARGTTAGATEKLQEVEEELKVGKRAVARGGVRIFTRMTETPVEETVRLREEHANVERRPVDRPATEADLAAFKEGSIEVREMAEEAVVSKAARVVAEVEVGKTATEREETVRDTVRRTSVEVENIGGDGDRDRTVSGQERVSARAGDDVQGSDGQGSGVRTSAGENAADTARNALGDHPLGTGVGAVAGGVAAGAAAGSVAGPVGTVAGAVGGAVVGGAIGKGAADAAEPEAKKDADLPYKVDR